jgi:hypothetical protein
MEHTMSKRITKAPPKAFDLCTRFRKETAIVTILDPVDGTDTGMRVEIGSPQSSDAQAIRETFKGSLSVTGETVTMDADVAGQSAKEQVIAVTRRWWAEPDSPDGLVIDGHVVACTPDAVRSLYTDPRTSWVYDQVLTAYVGVEGFFGASKARS